MGQRKEKIYVKLKKRNSRRIKGRSSLAVNSKNEFIMYIRKMLALQRIDAIIMKPPLRLRRHRGS